MKRISGILAAGLILLAGAQSQAVTLSGLTATDTDTGNITLSATLSGVSIAGGMVLSEQELTNGMLKIYHQPDMVSGGATSWSSQNWSPYFRGIYRVTATPIDFGSGFGTPVMINHEVGIARAISGVLNSMSYLTQTNYDAAGTWANVDTEAVKLHCIGYLENAAAGSVGCNLLNATVDVSDETDPDVIEALFGDTSSHYPLGTHYRFSAKFHKKPSSFMGMGQIRRYIWTPDATNLPDASGTLELDIDNCSPWRSDAEAPLGAHVGFAPVFFSDPEDDEDFGGTVMNTTAHYLDIAPSLDESGRVGLVINGHPGTTNYLSVFMPDTLLQTWGITNVEEEIAGYLNGAAINHSRLTITRIEGGTNIVYDVNGDGEGDSGYVFAFEFIFPATVSLKAKTANSVTAEIGVQQPGFAEIRINDSDNDVTVNHGENVTVTVQMHANGYGGNLVDCWIIANTPFGWYYYGPDLFWHAENNLALWSPVYQGALIDLGATPVLSWSALPRGAYTFYFAVSYPMTGLLDLNNPYLFPDYIGLNIE